MTNPAKPERPPGEKLRRRRLRRLALGACLFLAAEIILLASLRHDPDRDRLRALALVDSTFAAIICGIVAFTLRED